MKIRKLVYLLIIAGFYQNVLNAAPRAALPGDGTSEYACAVTTERDVDSMGRAINGSLRQRLDLYNRAVNPLCQFDIYFTFQNRTISISQPLRISGALHQGLTMARGTYIEGYGDGGTEDHPELLRVSIDATRIRDTEACAIIIEGGFHSKVQISGLNILVKKENKAICDENGHDLLEALSPTCAMINGVPQRGRDCEFEDNIIFTREENNLTAIPPSSPLLYRVNYAEALGPVTWNVSIVGTGGHSAGSGRQGGTGGSTTRASGGTSGGAGGSGGQSGVGGLAGAAGVSGSSGSGGVAGNRATGGSSGTAGVSPATNNQPPVFIGCALVKENEKGTSL